MLIGINQNWIRGGVDGKSIESDEMLINPDEVQSVISSKLLDKESIVITIRGWDEPIHCIDHSLFSFQQLVNHGKLYLKDDV